MVDSATPLKKDPFIDGSGGWAPPELTYGMTWSDVGSYGLRQYSGWIREEFLNQLIGRAAVTTYREMMDNDATVGAMIFAIQQAMRKVTWRIEPADDSAQAKAEADFVDSLRMDMSHTWEDFVTEALSMLGYGFSIHEIVYKRRMGTQPTEPGADEIPSSLYDDGRVGWRRLPIRGQDTVLKWFFDENGQIKGFTQQPWIGTLIDLPIEKLLLFRPSAHKNNPEGRSVLRSAYRSWYFVKRCEELEAILFERMSGFPVLYVPSDLMDAAQGTGPSAGQASQVLQAYKKLVTNLRVDEQMGAVLPSDTYRDADGKVSAVKKYDLQLMTPGGKGGAKAAVDVDKTIMRHKVAILMSLLTDFLQMGHEVRGTNNLGSLKVDFFYAAIEGWIDSVSSVLNRYALPRLWRMNGLDDKLMPKFKPDMPQRVDLDGLGGFIKNIASSGMALFPDEELEEYIRDAAGFPEIDDADSDDHSGGNREAVPIIGPHAAAATAELVPPEPKQIAAKKSFDGVYGNRDAILRMIKSAVAKDIKRRRQT